MKKLDSIKNKFEKIKKEIDEKQISTVGILDLRKYVADILKFQDDNNRIKEESRYNTDIDLDDLGTIFKDSENLWMEMSAVLDVVNTELDEKQAQVDKLSTEIARQKEIINMYDQKIASYTKMTRYDENKLNANEIDPEFAKLLNEEFEFESKKLETLKELMERHIDVCKEINVEINALRYGGEVKKEKQSKKKDGEVDWDSSFKDGNQFEKVDDQDNAFAEGLAKENWDKAFVAGTENIVGIDNSEEAPVVEEEATHEEEINPDGDLAELVVPDLDGAGELKPAKEVIPVTVEEAVPEVELSDPIVETESAPEVELSEPIVDEETAQPVEEVELSAPIEDTEVVPEVELSDPIVETESVPEVELSEPIASAEPTVEANVVEEMPENYSPVEEAIAADSMIPVDNAPVVEQAPEVVAQPAPVMEPTLEAAPVAEPLPAEAAPAEAKTDTVVPDIDWDQWDDFFNNTFPPNDQPTQTM